MTCGLVLIQIGSGIGFTGVGQLLDPPCSIKFTGDVGMGVVLSQNGWTMVAS